MVNEHDCNSIAITSLLKKDFPAIANQIESTCCEVGVSLQIIDNASDYWCRDFMPVQVSATRYIQFKFDPSYYKYRGYEHLRTDVAALSFHDLGEVHSSDIVLDGGNIIHNDQVAIVTDRIFKDNPSYKQDWLIQELVDLLELRQLVVIPALPYDITGHADGMVRFVNADTLLLNDFRLIVSGSYWGRLLRSLKQFKLILLPNDLHLNADTDDATGDYINMAIIKNHLLVPEYGNDTARLAHQIIRLAYREIHTVPVRAKELAVKAGVLHCATWNYWALVKHVERGMFYSHQRSYAG